MYDLFFHREYLSSLARSLSLVFSWLLYITRYLFSIHPCTFTYRFLLACLRGSPCVFFLLFFFTASPTSPHLTLSTPSLSTPTPSPSFKTRHSLTSHPPSRGCPFPNITEWDLVFQAHTPSLFQLFVCVCMLCCMRVERILNLFLSLDTILPNSLFEASAIYIPPSWMGEHGIHPNGVGVSDKSH